MLWPKFHHNLVIVQLCGNLDKGASIYDINKILGSLDPLPLRCPQNKCCLSANLGYLLTPLPFESHIWKPVTLDKARDKALVWQLKLQSEGAEGLSI